MNFFDRFRRRRTAQVSPRVVFDTSSHPDSKKESQGMNEEEVEALLASLDEPKGPERPQLYMFQHQALPEAVFSNHPELMMELRGESSTLPLLHFWSKAEVMCIRADLMEFPELDADDWEETWTPFDDITRHTHKRDGYTVHIYTMPEPKYPPEAHLIAIVHKDSEAHHYGELSPSTRYFTLEKTIGNQPPVLCEWDANGGHHNFGSGPLPTVNAFAERVFTYL